MKTILGNLLDQKPGILCHQVNTPGVMGAGLALQIREKWPHVFEQYKDFCKKRNVDVGCVFYSQAEDEVWIANLFGQSAIALDRSLTDYAAYPGMLDHVRRFSQRINSPVYVPTGIGCGIAGGDWAVMLPILEKHLPDATLVTFQPQTQNL